MLVVPEKSTIYPEQVTPRDLVALRAGNKPRFWRRLESRPPPTSSRCASRSSRQARDPGQLIYLPLDSHWNDLGALLLLRRALGRIGHGVQVDPADVRAGSRRYKGDIAAFSGGGPKTGIAPTRAIARPGERIAVEAPVLSHPVTRRTGPGAALPGTTLFLGDSYGDPVAPMLKASPSTSCSPRGSPRGGAGPAPARPRAHRRRRGRRARPAQPRGGPHATARPDGPRDRGHCRTAAARAARALSTRSAATRAPARPAPWMPGPRSGLARQ